MGVVTFLVDVGVEFQIKRTDYATSSNTHIGLLQPQTGQQVHDFRFEPIQQILLDNDRNIRIVEIPAGDHERPIWLIGTQDRESPWKIVRCLSNHTDEGIGIAHLFVHNLR